MRFLTAVLLFAASIVLVILGIGQRTVWAGPSEKIVTLKVAEDKPFFMIPNAALTRFAGKPTITVRGTGNLFLASGRESDVDSWLGSESNSIVTFGGPKNAAVIEARPGLNTILSPAGSDLWRQEIKGSGEVHLISVDPSDENALLLARDGKESAPGDISLKWPVARDFTFSTYLIISGAVLLALAFVTNFASLMKLRAQRRPRRKLPKAPQGPRSRRKRSTTYSAPKGRRALKRTAAGVPAAVLTISLLSGCSLSPTVDISASPTATQDAAQVPPALVASQVQRILNDTAAVALVSDSGKDRHAISSRFTGPALEVRSINYYLQDRQKTVPSLPAISATAKITLPVAAKEWPRTLMAVTRDAGSGSAPQMLVFQQDDPRTNYKVWYSIELHLKTPKVASTEIGAVPTPADSGFLVMKPTDIVSNYGDLINNPTTSPAINAFNVANDDFYNGIVKIQATNSASLKNGKITFSHTLANNNILGLNTASSGALVALYMNDVTVTKPKKATQAIVVSGLEKILLGSAGSLKGISTTYGDMMLFFVPNTNGGKLQLLGYTSGLIKVKGL